MTWPIRVVLAATSLGAAGIHLAMVPTHADERLSEGIAFALVGWLQVALAVAFVARPSRTVLRVGAFTDVVFVLAWVWARTAGAPFGPEAGEAHDAGFVDLTCVVLEDITAVVAVAVAALVRPAVGERLARRWSAPLAAVPAAVLVLATAAIASPSATDHAHDDSGGTRAHGDSAAGSGAVDDGHGHGDAEATATAAGPEDDLGLSLLENGEMAHHYGPDQPLDAETRAALVHQLELTRLVVERFPTLADAEAAGSRAAGGFTPGLGLHMSLLVSGMPEAPATRPRCRGDPRHPHRRRGSAARQPDLRRHRPRRPPRQASSTTRPAPTSPRATPVPNDHINPAIACPDGTYYKVPEDQIERYRMNKCRSNPQ